MILSIIKINYLKMKERIFKIKTNEFLLFYRLLKESVVNCVHEKYKLNVSMIYLFITKNCIVLYTFIHFSFISQVESIMHKAALVELTGCTIIMSLLGYYTIMVR